MSGQAPAGAPVRNAPRATLAARCLLQLRSDSVLDWPAPAGPAFFSRGRR